MTCDGHVLVVSQCIPLYEVTVGRVPVSVGCAVTGAVTVTVGVADGAVTVTVGVGVSLGVLNGAATVADTPPDTVGCGLDA